MLNLFAIFILWLSRVNNPERKLRFMETANQKQPIPAPVMALDMGEKRVGIAVSDALSISITRLAALHRTSWKQLLRDVDDLIRRFDAQTVVIGLPLRLNGSAGEAALEARRFAHKFAQSLPVPVYLQDERLSSAEAENNLRQQGHGRDKIAELVDSEAAAVILRDFLEGSQERILVQPS
ncbi:MAG TPA: Holliday junction resolvase RuvX [Pyrinomonadaceae bacterium]